MSRPLLPTIKFDLTTMKGRLGSQFDRTMPLPAVMTLAATAAKGAGKERTAIKSIIEDELPRGTTTTLKWSIDQWEQYNTHQAHEQQLHAVASAPSVPLNN